MSEAVVLTVFVNDKKIKVMNPVFDLKKDTGEHTLMTISGLLEAGNDGKTVTIATEMDIRIFRDGFDKVLFQGVISYVDIKIETANSSPSEYMVLKAMSYSCFFDQRRMNRTFQKKTETYDAVVNLIAENYPDYGIIIAPELSGKFLNTLTLQYQETDWGFFKRLASRHHLPIVSSHTTKGAKLFFGPAWSSNRYIIADDESDWVEEISEAAGKERPAFEGFRWSTEKSEMAAMDIGDMIQYKGIDFYVKSVELYVRNFGIQHQYVFGTKDSFLISEISNTLVTGLSLPGSIKDVSGNQVQVNLDIDALAGDDCWFSYATFYSMFYCMPEKGDRVYLYFPEAREDSAFVLTSVRVTAQGKSSSSQSKAIEGQQDGQKEAEQAEVPLAAAPHNAQQEVDVTPYIDALASQPEGKLVDFAVRFEDGSGGSAKEIFEKQFYGQGGGQVNAGGSQSPVLPRSDYDFESLAGDDKVKVLSSSDGKMVILDDRTGCVTVCLNSSTFINLSGSGISIRTPNAITLWAGGSINLNAKKSISIEAKENVDISCENSVIHLDPEKAVINGTDIKLNE